MNSYRISRNVASLVPEGTPSNGPTHEPRIVNASHGRLRVHLPHWSGTQGEQIVAAVRRLRGVTSAEANPLTGNVLIRFEPYHTDAATLLEALPRVHLEQPVRPPLLCLDRDLRSPILDEIGRHTTVTGQVVEGGQNNSSVYMTGTGRMVYTALGWTSVGMAVVGAITPGIPTAPFVILGGYFFIRSSPEAHEWLRQSRWFGPILRDWEAHRGVRRSVRNTALALIGGSMVLTALLPFSAPLKVTILALQAVGVGITLQLRVVEPVSLAPAGTTVQQGFLR
jgi:uncharacterized membrane protein YbaN (DUF454 family)